MSPAPAAHASTHVRQVAYVSNLNDNAVSVICTATNTVTATVTVGNAPSDVVITPSGRLNRPGFDGGSVR